MQDSETHSRHDERRGAPRSTITLPLHYRRIGRAHQPVDTTTIDVSFGGARIDTRGDVEQDDVLEIDIELADGLELTLQGRVVAVRGSGDDQVAHLAFDSMSAAAAGLLRGATQQGSTTSPVSG
ncbi:MAG: PilZ domain-containing protein [Acidimicrobiales bacterium]